MDGNCLQCPLGRAERLFLTPESAFLVRDGDVVFLEHAQMALDLSQEAVQGDASDFTMNLKT